MIGSACKFQTKLGTVGVGLSNKDKKSGPTYVENDAGSRSDAAAAAFNDVVVTWRDGAGQVGDGHRRIGDDEWRVVAGDRAFVVLDCGSKLEIELLTMKSQLTSEDLLLQ